MAGVPGATPLPALLTSVLQTVRGLVIIPQSTDCKSFCHAADWYVLVRRAEFLSCHPLVPQREQQDHLLGPYALRHDSAHNPEGVKSRGRQSQRERASDGASRRGQWLRGHQPGVSEGAKPGVCKAGSLERKAGCFSLCKPDCFISCTLYLFFPSITHSLRLVKTTHFQNVANVLDLQK